MKRDTDAGQYGRLVESNEEQSTNPVSQTRGGFADISMQQADYGATNKM